MSSVFGYIVKSFDVLRTKGPRELGRKAKRKLYEWMLFKPYVVDLSIVGVELRFLIANMEGRDWYGNKVNIERNPEYSFMKNNLCEGEWYVDVGAHHGLYSIFASALVGPRGHVYSFEAHPGIFEILKQNIVLNKLQNVTSENRAVSDKQGHIRIFDNSGGVIMNDKKHHGGLDIEATSLDWYFQKLSPQPVFLKVDVEGHEAEVLRGARRILATRPKILLEVHNFLVNNPNERLAEILELINLKNSNKVALKLENNATCTYDPALHTVDYLARIPRFNIFLVP